MNTTPWKELSEPQKLQAVSDMCEYLTLDQGFTFDPHDCTWIGERPEAAYWADPLCYKAVRGYAVGLSDYEMRLAGTMPIDMVRRSIQSYLDNTTGYMAGKHWVVGAWTDEDDDDATYLDVVLIVEDIEDAFTQAREQGQKAIFCLHDRVCMNVADAEH